MRAAFSFSCSSSTAALPALLRRLVTAPGLQPPSGLRLPPVKSGIEHPAQSVIDHLRPSPQCAAKSNVLDLREAPRNLPVYEATIDLADTFQLDIVSE